MSLNVGNISARFGLDPAEFLEKMRGVSGATKFFSDEMRRSMRETSRDGAEAFRTLDEMMGIHLNRPMTRLLVETFPSFAKGLQSILGGVAFGAVAFAVTTLYEKISKGIEKAQKAQEEWQASIRKTEVAIESVADSYTRKIAEAKGLDPLIKHAMAGAEEAKAAFEKVSAAIAEQNKKAEEAAGLWNRVMLLVGQTGHEMFTSGVGLAAEELKKQLGPLKIEIEEAFRLDWLHGTHDAMGVFHRDLDMATQKLGELQAQQLKETTSIGVRGVFAMADPFAKKTVTPEQLAAVQQWIDLLKRAMTIEGDRQKLEGAQSAAQALKDRVAFYRDLSEASAHFAPDTNPLHKLEGEITAAKEKAIRAFEEMRKAGAKALDQDHALAALDRWEHRLDEVVAKAKASADVVAAAAKLPTTIAATGQAPMFAVPNAMPTLGAGGLAGGLLDAFAKDKEAQLKLIAKAEEAALLPLQKYSIAWAELQLAFKDRKDADSLATKQAAQNALIEEYTRAAVKAADATHKLQEEQLKLMERSNDAAAGLKAYGIQLQLNAAENGKFTYDVLTASTKGAEDSAAKSLMMILESQRGGHLKLIHDLEALWSGYFKNLAEMSMKHTMDKMLGPLGKFINGGSAADQKGPTGIAGLSGAGTLLTHAGTELLSAAVALRTSAASGMGGGGGDAGGGSPFGDFSQLGGAIPYFASGGDATPGSSFISGESGAERVDLDRSGGAHITPLGVSGSGDTYHTHNYDLRGAVVTDDLMRKAEGAAAIATSEKRMMAAIPTLQREISLRRRS